ncbi:DUF2284 domain-containing protein [Desulfosporosinus sp. HMP52]|uniref:DUF2284 domain-containing protein n=1 Tax=Desulfosporosinus sp. HMP52 TaxID=1487923 RepID=UPI0032B81357
MLNRLLEGRGGLYATESYGILVMQLAPSVGIRYNNGPDKVTYFSMVFFSE